MYPWSKFWRTRVIISSMLIYHCVDLHLRVETFFEKDEAAENGGVDFEIGDLPLLHTCIEGWRKFHEETVRSLIVFSWQKIAFKSSLDLHFHSFIIKVRIEEKNTHWGCYYVSKGARGRVVLFSREKLGRG